MSKATKKVYQVNLFGESKQVCPVCGASVTHTLYFGRKPVFCSNRCRQKAYRRRKRADREARRLEVAHRALWGRSLDV